MTKRLLSLFLAVVFAVGVIPSVLAAKSYNPNGALKYASEHWDDGKGLCAEFVSDCLKAGGVNDTYEKMVSNLYNSLKNNGWGIAYKLTLTDGTSGRIALADNVGKVEAGDPIFYYCNICKTFTHAVLCNGADESGYLRDYAHNNPHNGYHTTWTFPHCGTNNWTMYSIRMGTSEKVYGNATSVPIPRVSGTENTKDGVVVNWNVIEGAEKYRVYRKVPGTSWKLTGTVETNTYTDTAVENGDTYLYTVRAVKAGVASQYYAGYENVYLSPMSAPTVKNKHTQLLVSWNKNEAADGYYVYRKVGDGEWERYFDFSDGSTSFYDTKVSSGTQYHYKVCAYKGKYVSTADTASKKFLFLAAPKILSVANAKTGLTVKWEAVSGANKYMVYRRAPGEKGWKLLETVTALTYTDTNVESGKVYRYTVKSAKDKALGGYDTEGFKRKCLAMPQFTSVKSSNGKVTLKWKAVEGATGCIVYRKLKGAKSWTRIATVKGKVSYVDSSVKAGNTYSYTIRAYYSTVKSAYNSSGTNILVKKGTTKSIDTAPVFTKDISAVAVSVNNAVVSSTTPVTEPVVEVAEVTTEAVETTSEVIESTTEEMTVIE